MPKDNWDNLEFKSQKVKYYEEDIEKMKTMTIKEQIEYKFKLKSENRYTLEEN